MRIALSVIFAVMIAILGVCVFLSIKSPKPIGKSLAIFIASLIPPVMGNLFIIASNYELLSTIGCYVYFLGMNTVFFSLIGFTTNYCDVQTTKLVKIIKIAIYTLLILDSIQLLLNIAFHHAFTIESIEAFGATYYRFVPNWGQTIHRVIDYTILAGAFAAFVYKLIVSPRVYSEKYLVIILAMVAVAAWQTFYIFTRTPVDISMTGFGVFGILVFLLSLYYRPLRLLDRMLGVIASRMPEGIIFFDTVGRCIWANEKALNILGINKDELDIVKQKLSEKFGEPKSSDDEWTQSFLSGSGDDIESYEIEKRSVIDDKNKKVGAYLSIRDSSKEQKTIERESYNATHDPLTGVLNRAGYDSLMDSVDLTKCFLLLIDFDSFKETNDKYGHTTGDKVLIKTVEIIQKNFREEDALCRLGGDEFAVVINDIDENTAEFVKDRIAIINNILVKGEKNLPLCSISTGGAFGKDAENSYELFNNADHALYETKFAGKCGFTLFRER